MKFQIPSVATVTVVALLALGCTAGNSNPMEPDSVITTIAQSTDKSPSTMLWGLYDCYLDLESGTIQAVPNRTAMFTLNMVGMLNMNPPNMSFKIWLLDIGLDRVIADVDVTLTHPLEGMPQYNGYDVRCVFMGNGSGEMLYNSDLHYPVHDIDQSMMEDPYELDGGGPDGYTRWFNATEFPIAGPFGFTKGVLGFPNYTPSATLCPYKYYTEGIGTDEDVFEFLESDGADYGVFPAGASITRNFYLEFPLPVPSVPFQYAVLATWEDPVIHPWGLPEAAALSVAVTDDLYFNGPDDWGGDLVLDFDVWNWHDQPSLILIESTVLSNVYEFTPADMVPISGGDNYSTYRIEIPSDNIKSDEDNEFWIICEYDNYDYSNYFPPGSAPDATLAAFFRYDLYVAYDVFSPPVADFEVVTPMPVEDFSPCYVEFDASGSYDPQAWLIYYYWDFDGDGLYDEDPDDAYTGDPYYPTHAYLDDYIGLVWLKVVNDLGMEDETYQVVDVTVL